MTIGAAAANSLWLARSIGHAVALQHALANSGAAQERWLRKQLNLNASSEFGRRYDFSSMTSAADFVRRVPLSDYDSIISDVERIRMGEKNVLCSSPVTHLAPTSGSTGSHKLIPFSARSQQGFAAAAGAWMIDLARQRPALIGGPAYWSISPLSERFTNELDSSEMVPVGYADDADYIGGTEAWLVRQVMSVPAEVRHVENTNAFWSLTLLALLRQRDLRLISIWHPSFMDLLLDAAAVNWDLLLEAIESGKCPWLDYLPRFARKLWQYPANPRRALELRRLGFEQWPLWWPRLQVLSCWGEQAAEGGWRRLQKMLPDVLVQAKGLLATEAVITFPIGEYRPLALNSHFFEFIDKHGEPLLANQLVKGEQYEVVVSNGGGLWRYRLGDQVECTRFLQTTPSLRFVGRLGQVSDTRGEKLSEAFIADALRHLWPEGSRPHYAAVQAIDTGAAAWYQLLVSPDYDSHVPNEIVARLETCLCANPHYSLARRLGQLKHLRMSVVDSNRGEIELNAFNGRLGDAKPKVLLDVQRMSQ